MGPDDDHVYCFGPFELELRERTLKREGKIVPLTPKAFETLSLLVQHSGRVLEKDQMMSTIWPDSFVEEATLAQNIFTLRRVLGETPDQAHYIETVPRRGYRFSAKVEKIQPAGAHLTHGPREPGGPAATSIAVLPFKTLSGDAGSEYFGLGMADALITKLSNIGGIAVRPTSAVLKYNTQDHDLGAAGRELRVQMALDGIVQIQDDRIRVTVQLVNLQAEAPLWADTFDEKFSDVFAVQDAISQRVVDALTLELTNDERRLLTKLHTTNSEAYRNYIKGRYLWSKWTEEGFKKSMAFFQRAIRMEPDYALPYAGLADIYSSLGFYGYLRPDQAMPEVKAMAERALRLDNQLAEARLPLAAALFLYDWNWKLAEREFIGTIEANPSYAQAHQVYGLFLTAMKRFDEASERLKIALEFDPVSPLIKTTAGFPYYYSERYDLAIEQYRNTLEEDPDFALAHVSLGDVYLQLGDYPNAIAEYQRAIAEGGEKLAQPYLGYAYAVSGSVSKAKEILEKLEQAST
ncbi:MAG TPA: winged helix-turn-helix domain-containing protein, partial [Blastocatellia bacterium]|nr:winged helix-turn-helix domain-containing protein [Blastocatellia bacterium]